MTSLRTALGGGFDVVLDSDGTRDPWSVLIDLFSGKDRQLRLIIVPDMACEFVMEAERGVGDFTLAKIAPDMPDNARRDVAVALRAGTVDVLFVTPERFAQQKFVRFMLELKPGLLVIASAQRSSEDEFDYCPSYDVLRTLRGLFPETPIVAFVDCPYTNAQLHALAAGLTLRLAPEEATPKRCEDSSGGSCDALGVEAAQKNVDSPPVLERAAEKSGEGWERAFSYFEEDKSLDDVANALEKDPAWCSDALLHFIRVTKRTSPFPWVEQPTYLTVAMVAGQAETNNPHVILPILGDRVSSSMALLVLAALENRARTVPDREV
ncbi:MAG: hypothetical protein L3K26_17625 [Candidatus Hydrogenedentes bacterium]|nr:hypothetical protein [Candidatus Hydrogenedentota bacterium]